MMHHYNYGIITINDDLNYGNRLQNFALTKLLSEYGLTTTVRSTLGVTDVVSGMKSNLRKTKSLMIARKDGIYETVSIRMRKGRDFTRRYADDSATSVDGYHGLRGNRLDTLVIGSDQVWNYTLISQQDLRMRFGLLSADIPAMSYAASIGINDIDNEHIPVFQEGLRHLHSISVREDRAKELVEQISGREATVVLDPTLMIERKTWETLFEGFVPDDERYVVTYFLGEPSPTQKMIIEKYAKERGLNIRQMSDAWTRNRPDISTGMAGPADFVELIAKSEYVFTDSYHACCLSLLFGKEFKVFNRSGMSKSKGMNSRMATLFRLFELQDTMSDEQQFVTIDYRHVNELLGNHRRDSRQWLSQALNHTSQDVANNRSHN